MRATIEHAGEDEINFPPVKGKCLIACKAEVGYLVFKISTCNNKNQLLFLSVGLQG